MCLLLFFLFIKGLLRNRHQVAKVLLSSIVGYYWGDFKHLF
ncbi:hypothetical protein BSUBE1_2470 [Bacillus subtilis E1]|nr:hypothetical protein BSUBE1_2470 [Bacillus subtilis E1]